MSHKSRCVEVVNGEESSQRRHGPQSPAGALRRSLETTISAAGWHKQLMRAIFCLGSLGLDADMAWIPASDP